MKNMRDSISQYGERLKKIIGDKYPWLLENKENIEQLLSNMDELERYGLIKLNENLLQKDFLSILTEHNIALELIKEHGKTIDIKYEPMGITKRVDFKIAYEEHLFHLQVRRLNKPEEDIKIDNLTKEFKKQFQNINKPLDIHLRFSRKFSNEQINPAVKYIRQVVESITWGTEYYFPNENVPLLSFHFTKARQSVKCLQLVSWGYLMLRDIGDRDFNRIKNTINKAYKAFRNIPEKDAINLILLNVTPASTIQNDEIKEICDALFQKGLRSKLSGVIILRGTNGYWGSIYQKQLLMNPLYSQNKNHITCLFKL